MDTIEAIKGRRSIRKYKPTPVDDRTIETVLDAARVAPSWANSQCWKFIVIRDVSTKEQLVTTFHPLNGAPEAVKQAPVLIVACAELKKSGYYQGQAMTDKGDWMMYDIGVAMENLVLAAQSLGLGTVHVGLFDAQKANNILGVPEGFTVVAMTPLGYPDQEPKPRPRKELKDIVFHEKFGNP